jgi:hypothetical protein
MGGTQLGDELDRAANRRRLIGRDGQKGRVVVAATSLSPQSGSETRSAMQLSPSV